MVECHTVTVHLVHTRQESGSERKQVMTGHPVFFILGITVPKAAIKQCLGNL